MQSRSGVALVLLLGACPSDPTSDDDGSDPPETVPLADMREWGRVVDEDLDAFADQRPADAVCDDTGYFFDPLTLSLEVQTDLCDYLTLTQPTLEPLEPGDVITVIGYHDDLMTASMDPSEGYLALAFVGDIEWEFVVPIPKLAATFEQTFTVDRSIPAGAELQFHLHNHGPNTWELGAILVTPAD